ncbi:MAG: hypothetical protein ACI8PZ_003083 [Myxococcota bacterium]|jgi:hypothetical protein
MKVELTRPRGPAIAPDGTLTVIGGNDANLVVRIGPDGERMPRPAWFPYTPSWAVAQLAHQLVVLTGETQRRVLREGLELATFDGQDRFRPVRLAGSDAGVLVAWSQEQAWIRAKLPKTVNGRKDRTSRYDLPVPGRLPDIAIAREAGQAPVDRQPAHRSDPPRLIARSSERTGDAHAHPADPRRPRRPRCAHL